MSASAELGAFDPFSPDTLQCPFPAYARLRSDAPVFHLEAFGLHFVTRHDLVAEVLRDPHTYSSSFGALGVPPPRDQRERLAAVHAEGYPRVPTMLTADPPEHTRFRRLVSSAFAPRVIARLEPEIRRIAGELIDSWVHTGSVEFVSGFAVPLPVRVIARALNVPDERLADFKRWSDDSIAGIGTMLSLDERIAAERGINEFQHYFAEQLEQRRTHPRDDLLTRLVQARIEPGEVAIPDGDGGDGDDVDVRPLDVPEMLSILQQLLVAGNETTTKLLTEMMLLLGRHPDQWDAVRADPGGVHQVVEETLRLSTPTQGMFRLVTRDTELGGVPLAAGSRVVVVFASANRDESLFDRPDEFDPDRDRLREHLAFGRGIHFCLGAALSRLEGRVALEELSRRIRSFELADSNIFEYYPSFLLRGLTSLDLDLEPAPRTGSASDAPSVPSG